MAATATGRGQRYRNRVLPARPDGVRVSLTPKRQREAADMGAFMQRMARALRKRAEAGDLEVMKAMILAQVAIRVEMRQAAVALREQHGYTWQEIGWAAGITRQSAQERFGK